MKEIIDSKGPLYQSIHNWTSTIKEWWASLWKTPDIVHLMELHKEAEEAGVSNLILGMTATMAVQGDYEEATTILLEAINKI